LKPVISEAALHVAAVDTCHQLGSSSWFGCWHHSQARQLYTFRLLKPVIS